jgi:hypothetical protein
VQQYFAQMFFLLCNSGAEQKTQFVKTFLALEAMLLATQKRIQHKYRVSCADAVMHVRVLSVHNVTDT